MLVVPARYDAHRACKRPDTAEQKRKVYGRDNYGDSDDDDGDDPKLRLQVNDYLRALIVPLLQADSAADAPLPADGDGAACKKALIPEGRAKHVLAGRCRYQVVIVGLAPHAGNAVVQHVPLRVRDRYARKTPYIQQSQHLGNALGVGSVKLCKRGGQRRGLSAHRVLLFVEGGVARGDYRIDIHKQQHYRQQNPKEREYLNSHTTHLSYLSRQSSSPRPTW